LKQAITKIKNLENSDNLDLVYNELCEVKEAFYKINAMHHKHWSQKVKLDWAKGANLNTTYFHNVIKHHNKRN
jgi:hypothetical protein